jgi:hypothetical protein
MESPATPVSAALVTLIITSAGSIAKPPSKSAFTGRSTAREIARMWARASSNETLLSCRPSDQASRSWWWPGQGSRAGPVAARYPGPRGSGSRNNLTDAAPGIAGPAWRSPSQRHDAPQPLLPEKDTTPDQRRQVDREQHVGEQGVAHPKLRRDCTT